MADLLVRTQPAYTVYIREGLDDLGTVAARLPGAKLAVVMDEHVAALYAGAPAVAFAGKELLPIVLPAGEDTKSAPYYLRILNELAHHAFTRDDAVVAFGGGVIGDLAAFAASTYMRGIHLLSLPTSLLAMVDSAVGGKTAINLDCGKNLCGTFYQPDAVYVCTAFLATLPPRERMCGWGEILKYALLSDTITEDDLRGDVTPTLIEKCLSIKADIVAADEREKGLRKLLNLGHTFGHAVERLSGFALSHGECVAKGLAVIIEVSRRYYDADAARYQAAMDKLASRGHDLTTGYDADTLMGPIVSDKKGHGDSIDVVLLTPELRPAVVRMTYETLRGLMP